MATKYVIHPGHEQYDFEECDARGYPQKGWSSYGSSFESDKEPEVGDCEIIKENGKLYRRVIRSVHFNGCVYEDTESYNVEYTTTEIKPDEVVIDKKWVLNKKKSFQEPKYGAFNGCNKIVIPYEYDDIETMMPNTFKVKKGDKWGVLDSKNGSFILPISYKSIERSGACWKISKDGNISYYDDSFNAIPQQLSKYNSIQSAYDELYIVENAKSLVGVSDREGNVIIPLKYHKIICAKDGFLAIEYDKYPKSPEREWIRYLFDRNGQMIMGPLFDKLADILDGETEINGEMYSFSSRNNVSVPDSVTKIVGNAFCWCNDLESVSIGKNVSYIGPNSFVNCHKLFSISVDEDNPFFSSEDGVLYDKDKTTIIKFPTSKTNDEFVVPESVKRISRRAFDESSIKKIILPKGLTEIGDWAFYGCSFIKEIEIPDSVTSIGERAFSECKSLESIKLPSMLKSIQKCAYGGCTSLVSIQIPAILETIGEEAFKGCSRLKTITFPDKLRKIGERAFEGCSNLKSISFPNSTCKIGKYAFEGCTQLETIIMPKTIQGWKDVFFPHWKKNYSTNKILTTLETYEDIKYGIPSTVNVELLPESLEYFSMGKYVDSNIDKLPISESDWNQYRDVILSNCKAIRTAFSGSKLLYFNQECSFYGMPFDKFASYGDYAFAHCEILKMEYLNGANDYVKREAMRVASLTIPDSVQSIGKGTFMGCTLLISVTIPESVTYLGDEAFKDCINLKEVTIPKSIPWLGKNTFEGCNSLKIILMSRKLYTKSKWKFPDSVEFLFYKE